MSRNYQRDERDWRRQQQASWQEEDQWTGSHSDDDYSMGLGQESRGARGEDYGRRGNTESGDRWARRESMRRPQTEAISFGEENRGQRPAPSFRGREQNYGRDYGQGYGRDYGQDYGRDYDLGWQSPSQWQRSQRRGTYEPNEGVLGGSGRYDGGQSAMGRNEGQFVGRGPRSYKRSDERIQEDINERLTQHGTIDATDIEVTVQNAEVTLRGSVDSRQAKRLAEDIADAVSGVKEVVNQIKVKQRSESGETKHDTESGGKQRKAS